MHYDVLHCALGITPSAHTHTHTPTHTHTHTHTHTYNYFPFPCTERHERSLEANSVFSEGSTNDFAGSQRVVPSARANPRKKGDLGHDVNGIVEEAEALKEDVNKKYQIKSTFELI